MPLLGYKETAHEFGMPIGTLYSLVSRRRIPHVRLGPRLVRFDLAELAAWIAQHRVAAVQPEDGATEAADEQTPRRYRDSRAKKRVGK